MKDNKNGKFGKAVGIGLASILCLSAVTVAPIKKAVDTGKADKKQIESQSTRIADLEKENNIFEADKNSLLEANRELSNKNNTLAEKNQELTEKNSALENDKQELANKNSQLTQDKENLTNANNQLAQEKENLTNANNQLTQDKQVLTNANNQLTQDKESLTNANNQLTQDKATLVQEKQALQDQLDELENSLSQDPEVKTVNKYIVTNEKGSVDIATTTSVLDSNMSISEFLNYFTNITSIKQKQGKIAKLAGREIDLDVTETVMALGSNVEIKTKFFSGSEEGSSLDWAFGDLVAQGYGSAATKLNITSFKDIPIALVSYKLGQVEYDEAGNISALNLVFICDEGNPNSYGPAFLQNKRCAFFDNKGTTVEVLFPKFKQVSAVHYKTETPITITKADGSYIKGYVEYNSATGVIWINAETSSGIIQQYKLVMGSYYFCEIVDNSGQSYGQIMQGFYEGIWE